MQKKLQVFVSSTYSDLQSERQTAVQAILDAGHIPAGMELFRAGNDSQLATVKKWIDASDVYMLILGGRYGSIEPLSQKSYTCVEYEYAIKCKVPIFAVVLSEKFLHRKAAQEPSLQIFDEQHKDAYNKFKNIVMSRIVKIVDDEKDIHIAIFGTLADYTNVDKLAGWIRGDSVKELSRMQKDYALLSKENVALQKQVSILQEKVNSLSKRTDDRFGDYTYNELVSILKSKFFTISKKYIKGEEDKDIDALYFYEHFYEIFSIGIKNSSEESNLNIHIFFSIAPFYMSYGLLEKVKIEGVQWERIQTTKTGMRFYGRLQAERLKTKATTVG